MNCSCLEDISEIEPILESVAEPEIVFTDDDKIQFIDLLTQSYHESDFPSIENMPLEFDEDELNEHYSTQSSCDLHLSSLCDDTLSDNSTESGSQRIVCNETTFIIPKALMYPKAQIIGTLTLNERREKIQRYLEKRKKRSWNKKIAYDCRKRVADNRMRIKGRFVTKDKAIEIQAVDRCEVRNLASQDPRNSW